jgi:hypothetical protein
LDATARRLEAIGAEWDRRLAVIREIAEGSNVDDAGRRPANGPSIGRDPPVDEAYPVGVITTSV